MIVDLQTLPVSELNEIIFDGMILQGTRRELHSSKDARVTAELQARVELIRRARVARRQPASKLTPSIEYRQGGVKIKGFTCEGWEV